SAFWHRFTVTAHSPVGLDPSAYRLRILGPEFRGFAENDLLHHDDCTETPAWLGEGLRRSLLNYLERRGLDLDIRQWFEYEVPRPQVSSSWLSRLLKKRTSDDHSDLERRVVWLGGAVTCEPTGKRSTLALTSSRKNHVITLPEPEARWLEQLIRDATPQQVCQPYPHMREACQRFPGAESTFNTFLASPSWKKTHDAGLVLV
ncbi:MAG: radical SAM protein, partial [Nitrospira sp.]